VDDRLRDAAPRGRHRDDAITALAKSRDRYADLAEDAERRVVAHVGDRCLQHASTEGIGKVFEVGDADAQDSVEAQGLGSANQVIDVEAVGPELLSNPERLCRAR
jgi:hypothetical protein